MANILIIPRTLGGTLILGSITPTPITITVVAKGRDGKITAMGRDSDMIIGHDRDGKVTGKGN